MWSCHLVCTDPAFMLQLGCGVPSEMNSSASLAPISRVSASCFWARNISDLSFPLFSTDTEGSGHCFRTNFRVLEAK